MKYDPISIATPITIRLKTAIKELFRLKIGWDDPLPEEQQEEWGKLISMMVHQGKVKFQRCTKPEDAVGRAELVSYWDGSDAAFAAAIYTRWKRKGGEVSVKLVASKAKFGTCVELGPQEWN